MIDFACKRFSVEEVIKCSLGLTKSDYELMKLMLKNDEHWFSTDELSKKLSLNLSTVQRTVKKLLEDEVVQRQQENLSSGGYVFYYRIKDKREIRKKIMSIVNNWAKTVEKELRKW